MKKLVYILGIIFLSIIVILNLFFTAKLDSSEVISINFNNIIYILGVLVVGAIVFFATKYINKFLYNSPSKKIIRICLFLLFFVLYLGFAIVWTIFVNPPIVADQIHVANLAQGIYRGDLGKILPNLTYASIPLSDYIELYHQQISLAFIFSIFFRFIGNDIPHLLRILNIFSIVFIVIGLYKICVQLSKKYAPNKVRLLFLIFTFISLPMLCTFIYGDFPSLALCLFSVYFMMKYSETKIIWYPFLSAIFTMIAYMIRMNTLIFIIATVIYLCLVLFKDFLKKDWKEKLINIFVIVFYIIISIFPSTLVQNYYLNKYNLDKNKSFSSLTYVLLAMSESRRGNGWYNEDIAEYAMRNPEQAKIEYPEKIKERLIYFSKNIGYTFNFYKDKIASMWTENTYAAEYSNYKDYSFENIPSPISFFQKAMLILICVCSLIFLIQNRKNISLDVIFLITIFIGGFAFHILWEAKSRYIIPYIVVLIPIASMNIKKFCFNKNK